MKITALILSTISAASAFVPASNVASKTAIHSAAKDDLAVLANAANPIVNYFDPLGLADYTFWNDSNDATIGFLRHAEIKHGRVAMAAFVGYCIQSNTQFPFKMNLAGDNFPSTDLSPEQQWDAIPEGAKWQIIGFIALLELFGEYPGTDSEKSHYMRGGRPGDFPSFTQFNEMKIPLPNLYDPLNLSKNTSEEKKARGLVTEINNGRLAMLGIIGFLSADKIEGSVPLLQKIAIPYDGDVMAPFATDFHFFE